jgi:predicted dehydrogenase
VTITFNARYSPLTGRIRELIRDDAVGKVVSVQLNDYLDTYHGATYFMRWNRRREISGSLTVHKAVHHFDLVQWWIGQRPVEVFAYGTRNFYGPDGPYNPSRRDGRVCPTCDERAQCPYYMRWHRDEWRGATESRELEEHVSGLQQLSHYENYNARRCIYDSEIDIEDTYSAVVLYDGGASMCYSLICSSPYEGYRLGINGLKGRIETDQVGSGYNSPPDSPASRPIIYMPLFGGHERIYPAPTTGGHGGADPLLRDELFIGPDPHATVQRRAPLMDGILSVLVGVAIGKSIAETRPIRIGELLSG